LSVFSPKEVGASARPKTLGDELYAFATELYPICRSITGHGVRQTLRLIDKRIPIKVTEVPSGSRVFDWQVPEEWNIEAATLTNPEGKVIVDFADHNLHVVSYSEPVDLTLSLAELRPRLHVARNPDWIPYRTSYYKRTWGLCVRESALQTWREGAYRVRVASHLGRGALTYGECVIPGSSREEVLFFTHVCHPSLANDNTSGIAVAVELAKWLASAPRRLTYRFVFAPGTIGSLCWLKRRERELTRVKHGLVLGLLGDPAPLTYKRSRRGNARIDQIAEFALSTLEPGLRTIPFEPYGYDERQLCSPGFNLPVGRLTRSVNDGYPEYHSSADDLSLISAAQLDASLSACQRICEIIEEDRTYVNLSPKGEPRLGKRGLYGSVGGNSPAEREHAMLWVLNQSDGEHSILDIARTSGRSFDLLAQAATDLSSAGLLEEKSGPSKRDKRPGRAPKRSAGKKAQSKRSTRSVKKRRRK